MINIVVIEKKEAQLSINSVLALWDDIQITGFGKDEYDALKLVESKKPDAAVISLGCCGITGAEIVPLLKRKSPHTAIILYAEKAGAEQMCDALRSGVSGFLLKPRDRDKLPETIRIACFGGWFISPSISQSRTFAEILNQRRRKYSCPEQKPSGQKPRKNTKPEPSLPKPSPLPSGISQTELRIMGCIGCAQTNKEIAEQLALTQGTVRNYISSAMRKAGLQNRTQIAIYALRNGLTSLF